jgi:hypothetical protein
VYETLAIEIDDAHQASSVESETPGSDSEKEPWGSELMNYVLDNQHEIVQCPWMGGAEVSLGEAMTTYSYPPNMTEKDVPHVMAVVSELLASRVEKKMETEEEENTSEDQPVEQIEDNKPNKQATTNEASASRAQSRSEVKQDDPKASQPIPPAVQIAVPMDDSMEYPDKTTPALLKATASERVELLQSTEDKSSTEVERNESKPAVFEQPDLSDNIQLASEDLEILALNYEHTENDLGKLGDAEIHTRYYEEVFFQPEEPILELQLEPYELDLDTEVLVDSTETVDSPAENPVDRLSEQLSQVNLPIEEIEVSLLTAAEKIETGPPEDAEDINKILNTIIELPAKLETEYEEVAEAEVQSELEELFMELFDRLELAYTPELIESLASLTIKWHFDQVNQVTYKAKADETVSDYGTHEIIIKLLAGLRSVKKIIARAGAIGKSALQLYHYDLPTELRNRLSAA